MRPAAVLSRKLVHTSHPATHHACGILHAFTQQLTSCEILTSLVPSGFYPEIHSRMYVPDAVQHMHNCGYYVYPMCV